MGIVLCRRLCLLLHLEYLIGSDTSFERSLQVRSLFHYFRQEFVGSFCC